MPRPATSPAPPPPSQPAPRSPSPAPSTSPPSRPAASSPCSATGPPAPSCDAAAQPPSLSASSFALARGSVTAPGEIRTGGAATRSDADLLPIADVCGRRLNFPLKSYHGSTRLVGLCPSGSRLNWAVADIGAAASARGKRPHALRDGDNGIDGAPLCLLVNWLLCLRQLSLAQLSILTLRSIPLASGSMIRTCSNSGSRVTTPDTQCRPVWLSVRAHSACSLRG